MLPARRQHVRDHGEGIRCHQQGVAVGLGAGYGVIAQVARRTRPVHHDDGIFPARLKLGRQQARYLVGSSSWRERDDQGNGPVRMCGHTGLRGRAPSCPAEAEAKGE